MSVTRRAGLAAYKRLIEAAPAAAVDSLDNQLVRGTARRAHAKDLKAAARWADAVGTPSKWYAIDGSNRFYFFRHKKTHFVPGDNAFGRVPTTRFGDNAVAVYILHGGQITDRRPSGWVSAATLVGANYGGLDGGPRDWGWTDDEDLDFDVREVERLRYDSRGPLITGHLSEYGERLARALAGV